MSLTRAIDNLKTEMKNAEIEPEKGLGTELFLFSSTLAPVANVDLLVTDENGRVLLSWRDDDHTEAGWHIPGSCIRFHETLDQSIQRCAVSELGCSVAHSIEPIKVYEFHWNAHREHIDDQRERAHFITLVYSCKLPENYSFERFNPPNGKPGHLRWFDTLPDDLLPIQDCYIRDWPLLKTRIMEDRE